MKKLLLLPLLLCIGCANLVPAIDAMDRNNTAGIIKVRTMGFTLIGADPKSGSGPQLNIGTMQVETIRVGRDINEPIKIETQEGVDVGADTDTGITSHTLIETTGTVNTIPEPIVFPPVE